MIINFGFGTSGTGGLTPEQEEKLNNSIERVELVYESNYIADSKNPDVALTFDEIYALVLDETKFVTLKAADIWWLLPSMDFYGDAIMFTTTDIISENAELYRVIINSNDEISDYFIPLENNNLKKDDLATEKVGNFSCYPTVKAVNDALSEIKLFKFPNATIMGAPDINHGQVSNFTNANYLVMPSTFNVDGRGFEISLSFTTGSDVTTPQNILGGKYCMALYIDGGKLTLRVSSNGTSWDLVNLQANFTVEANTTYYIKITFDRLQYKLLYSTNGTNYTEGGSVTAATEPYDGVIYIGVGNNYNNPFKGSVNLNKWEIKFNNNVVWQGMDDVGLASRLATDMANIDEAGIEKVKEIASEIADEEDITKTLDNKLKLKDREYGDGMGYVIVRKDKTFADQVTKSNTIYEIRYDFDLNNVEVNIPENCILKFEGGSLSNGKLIGNNTSILSEENLIFYNITISGIWHNEYIYSTWFENVTDSLKQAFLLANENILNNIYINDTRTISCVNYVPGTVTYYGISIPSNTNVILNGEINILPLSSDAYYILYCGGNNINITGNGKIIGDVDNHIGTTGEHGMGIAVIGKYISIEGVKISKCWGDGIYVLCDNLLINNVIINNCRRQGISIIKGEDIEIKNSEIYNIQGTSPERAIDIEPNKSTQHVRRVTIDSCYFHDCAGGLIESYEGLTNEAIIENITIKNCKLDNGSDNTNCLYMRCIGETLLIENNTIIGQIAFSRSRRKTKAKFFSNNITGQLYFDNIYDESDVLFSDNTIKGDITFGNILTNGNLYVSFKDNNINCNGININNTRISCDFINNKINSNGDLYIYCKYSLIDNNIITLNEYSSSDVINYPTFYLRSSNFINNILYCYNVINVHSTILSNNKITLTINKNIESIIQSAYYSQILNNNVVINILNGIRISCLGKLGGGIFSQNVFRNSAETYNISTKYILSNNVASIADNTTTGLIFSNLVPQNVTETQLNNNYISDLLFRKYGTSSERPSPYIDSYGFMYFDTTLNKPIFWTGSNWVDSDGVLV